MKRYQLMNKDVVVLEFSCARDEFDEPVFLDEAWKTEIRPIGFTSVAAFLERRKAPKHREHIFELLEKYGCNDIEGFIRVTHAVSLNDTLWVREEGSLLEWKDVSLYQNDFNELISIAAFEGIIPEEDLSATSPEFSTDGTYAKCWVRDNNTIFLYKTGSKYYEIEPFSEFLATQLSTKICVNPVSYDLDFYNNKLISKCALFTNETMGFVPMSRLFKQKVPVSKLLSFFNDIGSGDAFRRMCVLDALIFNTDRHFGNFGVLFNNDTMKISEMAPVFDNNRSLFFANDDCSLLNPSRCVRNVVPRLGADFNITASQLLTPTIRSDLKNLSGFKFEQHPRIKISQERLDVLSKLVNDQINLILDRVTVRLAAQQGKYDIKSLDINMGLASCDKEKFNANTSSPKKNSEFTQER